MKMKKISIILVLVLLFQIFIPALQINYTSFAVEGEENQNEAEENQNLQYKELSDMLEEILAQRDYTDEVKNKLRSCLQELWENYDEIYQLYRVIGYPEKKQYILDTFLYPLRDKTKKIEILDKNNEEDVKYIKDTYGVDDNTIEKDAGFNSYGDIVIFKEYDVNCVFIHEIYHSKQKHDYTMGNLLKPIIEGGAVNKHIISKYFFLKVNDEIDEIKLDNIIWKHIEGLQTRYSKKMGDNKDYGAVFYGKYGEYDFYDNLYTKLLLLTNYETMEELAKSGNISNVINYINEKYGNNIGNEIVEYMEHLSEANTENFNIEYTWTLEISPFDTAINLENDFLDCFFKNIEKLDNKEDIENYFNIWRMYKNVYMAVCTENEDLGAGESKLTNITDKFLNYKEIEDALVDKAVEYSVFPEFSQNENTNKLVIKALLCAEKVGDEDPHIINRWFETGEFPISLNNAVYWYEEQEDRILLYYKNVRIIIYKDGNIDLSKYLELDGLEAITQKPLQSYNEGDKFKIENYRINAIYVDGSRAELKEGEYEIINGDSLAYGQTKVTISYHEKDVIKTYDIPVTVIKNDTALSTKYTEEKDGEITYIVGIDSNTTVAQIKEAIGEGYGVTILGDQNKVLDNSEKIATGNKIIVSGEDEGFLQYVAVVKGDCDGNGEVNFDDILQVNKHRLKKALLEGAFEKAADVNKDNVVNFDDILQINKFRLKKITTL